MDPILLKTQRQFFSRIEQKKKSQQKNEETKFHKFVEIRF